MTDAQWRSGAGGEGVADGSFGAWRGTPVQAAGTWSDTTDAVQRAQGTLASEYAAFGGDLDIAVGGLESEGTDTWQQAAQGAYVDRWTAAIRKIATARAGKGGKTYVRFVHEMNGDWYQWKVTPGDVEAFKASWRMFHDLLKREFPEALLVFGANAGTSSGNASVNQIWPGDDVVDVVGVDFYDGWPRFDQATWQQHLGDTEADGSPRGIGAWQAFAKAHGKPLSFPEWGLNPAAGTTDNPYFIQAMHDFFAANAAAPGGDNAGKVVYDLYYEMENDGFKITSGQNGEAGKVYRSLTWGGPGSGATGAAAGPPPGQPAAAQPESVTIGQAPLRQAAAWAPTAGLAGDAQALKDLPYATSSAAQKLDLYLPARTGTVVPLVVVIHGGAFSGGDKADPEATAPVAALVDKGYAVASINYRLSGEAPFPAGVQDSKAAVRWLRAHAADYGIDPARVAAWGTSAGGYLATMLGATGSQASALDDPTLGNPGVSSAVEAVVSWYGPSDFAAMDTQAAQIQACQGTAQVHNAASSPESAWLGAPVQSSPQTAASNPIAWIASAPTGGLPPFLLGHGSSDCTVPSGQSAELSDAIKKAGGRASLTLVDGGGHGGDAVTQGLLAPSMTFIQQAFSSASAPASPTPAPSAPATAAVTPVAQVTSSAPTPSTTRAAATSMPVTSSPASAAPPARATTTPPPVQSSGS